MSQKTSIAPEVNYWSVAKWWLLGMLAAPNLATAILLVIELRHSSWQQIKETLTVDIFRFYPESLVIQLITLVLWGAILLFRLCKVSESEHGWNVAALLFFYAFIGPFVLFVGLNGGSFQALLMR